MKKNALRLVLFFLLLGQYHFSYAQTFECDNNFYLALSPGIFQPSILYQANFEQLASANNFSLVDDNYGLPLNCIGYNVQDKFIYGINPYDYHLYRINAFGELTDLGIPANLDTINYEYWAGCFSPQGNRMVVIGRDKTDGRDKVFYSIRFDSDTYDAGILSLHSEDGSAIEDLAFDPVYGDIYAFDGLHQRIVTLDLGSGTVVSYESTTLGGINSMGSIFFDEKGILYGYGSENNEENTLFKIDKFERTIIDTYDGPAGAYSDGCSCPYRITFEKIPSSHEVVPCSEFTVAYATHNTGGKHFTRKILLDSFPEHFTITEIIRPPVYGTIESGIGTNKLHVSGMDILLGYDTILIRVEVGPEASGSFTQHAVLDGFPLALGKTVLSDDLMHSPTIEPTTITVLSSDLLLDEEVTYICADATLEFGTVDLDLIYLWSDGSTSPTIEITEAGLYWVEISNDCVTMRDTIIIEQVDAPLTVNLGPDQLLDIGNFLNLGFETNANTELSIAWITENSEQLSCADCPNPIFTPTSSSSLIVTIADAYGCTATDELYVEVNTAFELFIPNIFSPNGDGMNDLFFLQGKIDFDILQLTVFDRWGSVVHQSQGGTVNSLNGSWDGNYRGELAPKGVYLWIATVRLPDGNVQQLNGDISLIR